MIIWTVVTLVVVLLQCQPLSLSWNPNFIPGDGKGHCMDRTVFTNYGYAFSAMDIFFDWAFALIPIAMLRGLQLSLQVKISLFFVLGLGAL
jgi:hypothetical protein